jgi:hypothetical protein
MPRKKYVRDYIPNFDKLYEKVVEFVKAHQGEKGYIDCQPCRKLDTIYGIIYDDDMRYAVEKYVYAVRVVDGDLECLLEDITFTYNVTYQPEDFTSEETKDQWHSVRWSDVYYVHTLINIAECIEEYVD